MDLIDKIIMYKPKKYKINEFSRKDYSITGRKANVYSIALGSLLLCLSIFSFSWIWGSQNIKMAMVKVSENYLQFLLILLLSIFVHEVIHFVAWIVSGRKKMTDFEFGFSVKYLSPYVHCKAALQINSYRLGIAMPGVVLGILPIFYSLLFGKSLALLYGLILLLMASGDFLVLWIIRGVSKDSCVRDHPSRIGCVVVGD